MFIQSSCWFIIALDLFSTEVPRWKSENKSTQRKWMLEKQCDQIWLILKGLGNKLAYKSSPKIYNFLGYLDKHNFLS